MAGRQLLTISVATRSGALGAIWLVLTGASADGLVFGALAVPAAVWMSLRLSPPLHRLGLWRLIAFVPQFLSGSVRGGVDVAWRAFMPRMPIAPAWIVVPVNLPDAARVAFGAKLSLMPGTLAAGAQDGKLLVHVLDRDADHRGIAATGRQIAAMIGIARDAP